MQVLSVTQEVGPSRTVLSVAGELDIATAEVLRDAVREALEGSPAELVLDLTPTAFLDSTGARALAVAAKAGATAGVRVVAVVPPENRAVRRVVDFMQFGELLPVCDDLPSG